VRPDFEQNGEAMLDLLEAIRHSARGRRSSPRAAVKDVPPDYYVRLHAAEEQHWWHTGMRRITEVLLQEQLARGHLSLLDAGCGTGGFLAWAAQTGAFDRLCGVDISAEATEFARHAAPKADVQLAPLNALPYDDAVFDLVVLNDVLQHVDERSVQGSVRDVHRVLREGGTLFVRTNGGRRARRERLDWRLYDAQMLREELERGGFRVERLTHANAVLSAWGSVRRRAPRAPTITTCGISDAPGAFVNRIGSGLLALEARYLQRGGRLPYGHTLFALARRLPGPLAQDESNDITAHV
jgi:SAM-dependent methyltransferase